MTTATALKPHRVSLEKLREILSYTEGMEQRAFRMSADGDVGFILDVEAANKDGAGIDTPAAPHPHLKFRIGSDEYGITSEACLQAYKQLAGIPAKLYEGVPLVVTEPLLNYQFRNEGLERKALIRDGVVVSFCRAPTEVYSTLKLLDSILAAGILPENASFINVEHSIDETHFTVLDETVSTRLSDGSVLTAGVHLQTSLVGLKPLNISSFVLRSTERSTGGQAEVFEGGSLSTQLPTHAWDRTRDAKRISADSPEEAERIGTCYDFVASCTGQVLASIEEEFERITHLSEHTLDQRVGPYLDDVIKKFKLPPRIYMPIMQEFAHSESARSTLDLWMAFGHVGLTDLDLTARLKKMLYQTAGEIARNPNMCSQCHRSLLDFGGASAA